jgi:hypothetical protein
VFSVSNSRLRTSDSTIATCHLSPIHHPSSTLKVERKFGFQEKQDKHGVLIYSETKRVADPGEDRDASDWDNQKEADWGAVKD